MLLYDFVNPTLFYIFLNITFIICTVLIFKKREFLIKHKNKIFIIVAILLGWTQFARYIGIFFAEDQMWTFLGFNFRIVGFDLTTHLPFYICRFSVVVLLIYSITRYKKLEPFLFYWGATGLAGVWYPNGPLSNIATLTETFFVDHFVLALAPFFIVSIQGYKPKFKDAAVISGFMFVLLLSFIPINLWLNADYFYLEDQSIFGVIFGQQAKIVFIFVHSLVAFGFFSLYYHLFKERKPQTSGKIQTEN